jgi:hypothetical protein
MLATLALIGTLIADSVPCARLELEDGRKVWISGLPDGIAVGDKVALDGAWRILRNCNARAFVVDRDDIILPAPRPKD